MTSYKFGDVILVAFPFSDAAQTKKRPAAVVSSPEYHAQKKDVIVVAVSSKLAPIPSLGEAQIRDWQAAGLVKQSALKANIATVVSASIDRRLGALSEYDAQALRELLNKSVG